MCVERTDRAISSTEGIELGHGRPTNRTNAYGKPATKVSNAMSAPNPRILCDI
jgi:hypothetical protein